MSSRTTALRGEVVDFDRAVGLGMVRADDGTVLEFHCIEIADGTRDIAPGTRVAFDLLARFGRLQAAALTPD